MSQWLDAPTWIHERLGASLPAWLVTPEADAKVNRYPALIWSATVANPDARGLWSANLTLTLLCAAELAPAAVELLYDTIQAWQTPGPLHGVELLSMTQSPSTTSNPIHQYVLVYSLTWDL